MSLGPSPHTRGKQWRKRVAFRQPRDHPRIRGEFQLIGHFVTESQGPPPHTRRVCSDLRARVHRERTTSAYAESVSSSDRPRSEIRENLRVRGECHTAIRGHSAHRGTPPRTRRIHFPTGDYTPAAGLVATLLLPLLLLDLRQTLLLLHLGHVSLSVRERVLVVLIL